MSWRCYRCGNAFAQYVAFCTGCWTAGCVVLVGDRAQAEIDAVPEVVSAGDLARAAWQYVSIGSYPTLRIGRGSMVLVYGPSASGKSTLVSHALNSIEGPVVLQSTEESPGPSLGARLQRVGVRRSDFVVVGRATIDQLATLCRQRKAVALGIDSVQLAAFTAPELRHLLAVMPSLHALFVVSQVNKSGRPEGREAVLHEADVAIEVAEMRWRLVKSRFQPTTLDGSVVPASSREEEDDGSHGIRMPVLSRDGDTGTEVRSKKPPLRVVPRVRDSVLPARGDGAERSGDREPAGARDERADADGAGILRPDERDRRAAEDARSSAIDGSCHPGQ